MIAGIGVDVVDIERFSQSLNRTPALAEKLFTLKERDKPAHSLAARFAAKEALYKALSPSSSLAWHDAEVINAANGKPDFHLHGQIAELVGGATVHLSLSHDGGVATAMVVIEK